MQTINRFLYGPTVEEKVRIWQGKIRGEQRALDREIRQLKDATNKVEQTTKQLAKKGDVKSARILAKEIVRSRKQMDRLSVSKAHLGSINSHLIQQLAIFKVKGTLQKSTEIMKASNELVKLPMISQAVREMSIEMTKAGIMEEMLEDSLQMDEDEELEDEADAEVDKVLYDLTEGKLGQADTVKEDLPSLQDQAEDDETEKRIAQIRQEMNGILSG